MHYLITAEQLERLKHICTASKNFKMARELESIKTYDTLDTNEVIDHLAKARSVKTTQTIAKIQNAIDVLKSQDKSITAYRIHKLSKVSYQAIKRHLNTLLEQKQ